MFSVVQFLEGEGGTVSVIVSKWLTPKKTEIFWPPTKDAKAFDKLLQQRSSPDERWKLYGIDRVFYETDQLDKAKKKLKLVEFTSDIQTEEETEINKPSKRKIIKNYRYISSDDDDNECDHSRPPPLKKPLSSYLDTPSSSKTNNGSIDHNGSQIPQTVHEIDTHITETIPVSNDSKCGFQDKVVSLLAHIKTQNDVIMSLLQDKGITKPEALNPEFKFPLETFENLETVEQLLTVKEDYDNVVGYFKSLGGRDINNKVSRVMKAALSDSMASKFNFYGKRSDKKAFAELRLRASIVESLKSTGITEKDIEDSIKVWLKHAPERAKKHM